MNYHSDPIAERAAAWETMQANAKRRADEARERPFRFEDLNGKPEPASWGPKYTKPVKTKRACNDETNIPTNCASGQKRCFDAAKHRTKIRAEFAADAARDRLAWATSKAIKAAYAQAMAEKRARLALSDMREAA